MVSFKGKLQSRKFLLTGAILLCSMGLPVLYKHLLISDQVTTMVLGILGGVGVSYGVVNLFDRHLDIKGAGLESSDGD